MLIRRAKRLKSNPDFIERAGACLEQWLDSNPSLLRFIETAFIVVGIAAALCLICLGVAMCMVQ